MLQFPSGARLQITGLRNPCHQINGHTPGLMNAVLDKAVDESLVRKAGVMAIVLVGGAISANDSINISLPAKPWFSLKPV
jgi:MOSC domain-containing protein YiiM